MRATIRLERTGPVAVLRLDRPDRRNAITTEMKYELLAALDELETETTVLLLTGTAPAFCAGADLAELAQQRDDGDGPLERLARVELTQQLVDRIRGSRFATVAVVNGVAAGGGISLALACDVVLASEDADFVWAFLDRGLVPDGGLADHLRDLLGSRRATSLLLRTARLTSTEAHAEGLVDEVLPADELWPRAQEIAQRLESVGPATVALLKRSLGPPGSLGRAVEALAQGIALAQVQVERGGGDATHERS